AVHGGWRFGGGADHMLISEKLIYLAQLQQLVATTKTMTLQEREALMKRIERVCDSIERDLELGEDATTTVMVNAVTRDAGELAKAVVREIERLHLFRTGCL